MAHRHMALDGEKVKALIKARGLSQRRIAKIAEVSFGSLTHYLSGRSKPSPETLTKIARALSVEERHITLNTDVDIRINVIKQLDYLDAMVRVGEATPAAYRKLWRTAAGYFLEPTTQQRLETDADPDSIQGRESLLHALKESLIVERVEQFLANLSDLIPDKQRRNEIVIKTFFRNF